MRKNDIILMIVIVLFASVLGGFFFFQKESGHRVRVTVGGEEYGIYSLEKDQVIDVYGKNQVQIKDGKVSMIEADCPDQLCVNMIPIEQTYEMIVCLPNQVIVEIFE